MSQLELAVVIPVFNGALYITEAVESALRQTEPTPVFVIDDGSIDATPDVLASFGGRITVIRQPNGGTSAAWNTALREVDATWLVGLDADDALEPDAIALLSPRSRKTPCVDVVYSDYVFIDSDGAVSRQVVNPEPTDPVRQLIDLHDRLGEPDNFVPFGHVRMYRRAALLDAGGYDETYRDAEDFELLLRLARRGATFERVPSSLYRYRWHTTNKGVLRRPNQVAEVRRAVSEAGLR